jgi:response regulator RpfG family c-di-GMP phosphodiesterase/tRNA A-37 threonylcarbamoyl transferase component Bud32
MTSQDHPPTYARPTVVTSNLTRRVRLPLPSTDPSHRFDPKEFVDQLVSLHLLDADEAQLFAAEHLGGLHERTERGVGLALIQAGLLTHFQVEHILLGTTYDLVLGNYRKLDKLGSGGMGDVFLAEHRFMKRLVAVKTVPVDENCLPAMLRRFHGEMRALAELHHPNIVTAYDAGELVPPTPDVPGILYLVMEYLAGGDLERLVRHRGPLPVPLACEYVRQAALGLQAAHDVHLIHRDVKPSNMLLAVDGQVKLVDFGLVREFSSRSTDPRALLGTVDYMAPEQSLDASTVGKQADIYGLGASLFWLLTGETPYPRCSTIGAALRQIQKETPRRVRDLQPGVPAALSDLIERMMHRNPAMRPPQPLAVAVALEAFGADRSAVAVDESWIDDSAARPVQRVLIVEDERAIRCLNRRLMESMGCICMEATDAAEAMACAATERLDLVLLDRELPDGDGYDLCRSLREQQGSRNLKIIVVSGSGTQDELAEALRHGADDYVVKPYETRQLLAKVENAFRLTEAQDRSAALAGQLREVNAQLRHSLDARQRDVRDAHRALLFAMARIGEARDGETRGHLQRLREYSLALARAAARLSSCWAAIVDDHFLHHLELCVPLHDIGKIAVSDDVLRKPASLTAAERHVIEQHPVLGDRMLQSLAKEHGTALEFLGTARDIVRCHHERWDGRGYPDGFIGEAIPAAARLTAVADVYDALRRQRPHKPAMSHDQTMAIMMQQSRGQFDPSLLRALALCQGEFNRIFREIGD